MEVVSAPSVDEVLADPAAHADEATLLHLARQLARAEAAFAQAAAAFAAQQGHADEHATATAWLTAKTHLARSDAARLLRLGRACRHLPVAAAAWSAGEISGRHVGLLAAKRNDRTAEAMARDEAMLVGHARELTFRHFTRAVAYWEQLADPDGVEVDAARLVAERELHVSQTLGGAWRIDGGGDPISGSIVAETIAMIERELFEAEWAEAKERLGRTDITVADLARTPAQRRWDALREMAARARTAPANGRRPAPLLTVLVGYETLHGRICELADGTVVTPGSLLPWLDEALVERAVFSTRTRVEISETTRLFTGATRRGTEVRDRHCTVVEGCDVPANRCQVDHILAWAAGGLTTQENGRMGCGFHNRLRNRRRSTGEPPPLDDTS